MQIRKPHRQRISLRMLLREQNSNVFGIIPGKFCPHKFLVPSNCVLVFFRYVVPVPRRNLYYHLAGLGDHRLAAESGV